jgi:hypothetical protein
MRLPVIMCVDDWGHWITVVRHEEGRFVVIDSKTAPVLQVLSWPQLRNRWQYFDELEYDELTPVFDLHPVRPRFKVRVKAQFSVERAHFLRRQDNADLAEHWDDYLGDLLDICRPRSANARSTPNRVFMSQFLRRHGDMLVSRLTYWHGDVPRERVQRLLRNFCFVADTYALTIPIGSGSQALAELGMLLGMWAASRHGVDEMYGG